MFQAGHRRTIDHKHIVIVCLGLHTISIHACTPVGNLNPKEETSFADDAPGFPVVTPPGRVSIQRSSAESLLPAGQPFNIVNH